MKEGEKKYGEFFSRKSLSSFLLQVSKGQVLYHDFNRKIKIEPKPLWQMSRMLTTGEREIVWSCARRQRIGLKVYLFIPASGRASPLDRL